jgi:methanogenic corrinoid protein MtbC1
MHDLDLTMADQRVPGDLVAVERFASDVVSVLATRGAVLAPAADEALLREFVEAVSSADEARVGAVFGRLKRARVPAATIVDSFIPAAARRMGEAWMEDRMSFAEVSIGVGRLQASLRGLCVNWIADNSEERSNPVVLMATPKGETHVLGAMIATAKLRRAGVSVCLRVAPERRELAALRALRAFDAAMLSVGCPAGLDGAADLVKTLTAGQKRRIPIVVGGAALLSGEDVGKWTGADFATSDIDAAIQFCGFSLSVQRAMRRA